MCRKIWKIRKDKLKGVKMKTVPLKVRKEGGENRKWEWWWRKERLDRNTITKAREKFVVQQISTTVNIWTPLKDCLKNNFQYLTEKENTCRMSGIIVLVSCLVRPTLEKQLSFQIMTKNNQVMGIFPKTMRCWQYLIVILLLSSFVIMNGYQTNNVA